MTEIAPLNCMKLDLKLGNPSQKGYEKFEQMLGASSNWIIRIWPNLQATNCWESTCQVAMPSPVPTMPKSPVSQENRRGLINGSAFIVQQSWVIVLGLFLGKRLLFATATMQVNS